MHLPKGQLKTSTTLVLMARSERNFPSLFERHLISMNIQPRIENGCYLLCLVLQGGC